MEPLFTALDGGAAANTGALAILVAIGVFFLTCWIVKLLWNSTLPALFEIKKLRFWQAVRITLLAWILFAGWTPIAFNAS